MPQLPPNWAFEIYSKLWLKFGDLKFSNDEAHSVINHDTLNQALSRLKRAGWLTISMDPQDARKSLYSLKKPENVINETVNEYAKTD